MLVPVCVWVNDESAMQLPPLYPAPCMYCSQPLRPSCPRCLNPSLTSPPALPRFPPC